MLSVSSCVAPDHGLRNHCHLMACVLALGCSGTNAAPGSGGATGNVGGSYSGGNVGTSGGAISAGGKTSGGTAGTAAAAMSAGGAFTSGGNIATGGVVGGGGAGVGAGGTISTGGAKGTGGSQANGGTPPTGGVSASGGAKGTGGSQANGGTPPTGGVSASGGASGIGGSTSNGGTAVSFGFVVTNRYDNQRSGSNAHETVLNASNVNQAQFGLRYSFTVDGQIYAQPLYLGNLKFADGTTKNTLFAATEHNTVYAFDADGGSTTPIWSINLGPSGLTSGFGCSDMTPETGITSTPVIDTAAGILFVVSKGTEGGNWVMRLHALDIRTGQERPGSPLPITATVSGIGDGNAGGKVTFDPHTQLNRPGLLLENGTVYLAFASHCDFGPYHGWILGYSYANGAFTQTHVFNVSPNGSDGGIWQSGIGLSSDGSSIYFAAGNGSTNPSSTPPDVSESIARVSLIDLGIQDFFTSADYVAMNSVDSDLSSGAPLLPHNRIITGTKGGIMFLLDSTNLGKFNAAGNKNLQTLTPPNGGVWGGPVDYQVPGGPEWVYVWPVSSPLLGYQWDPATYLLKTPPTQQTITSPSHPGGILTLSSNGTAGSGILWANAPQGNSWHQTVAGTLYAFDASDITKLLWSSQQNVARDALGNYAKFVPPVVVNGRVFMATFSNAIRVYGPLN